MIGIFGGLNSTQGWLNDLLMYNIITKTWNTATILGEAPSPRDKAAVIAKGTSIYIFGGFGPQTQTSDEVDLDEEDDEEDDDEEDDDGGNVHKTQKAAVFGWFNDVIELDLSASSPIWKIHKTTGQAPTPRAACGLAILNNQIYVFGGRDAQQRTNDLYSLNLDTLTWTKITTRGINPSPRSFHTLTAIGSKLVVYGGLNIGDEHLSDVHVFDTTVNAWLQPKININNQRAFHTATLIKNLLYVYGGTSEPNPNDLLVMNIDPILNAPSPSPEELNPPTQSTGLIAPKGLNYTVPKGPI